MQPQCLVRQIKRASSDFPQCKCAPRAGAELGRKFGGSAGWPRAGSLGARCGWWNVFAVQSLGEGGGERNVDVIKIL